MSSWLKRASWKGGINRQGENDDEGLVVVPLVRISSKEDVLKPMRLSVSSKKRTSSKEGLPEDAAPSLKRINSKEDIKEVSVSTISRPPRPTSSRPTRKKSIPAPKLAGLEVALANQERLEEAITEAEKTHCAEGLKFLREYQILESMEHGEARRKMYTKLQSRYFKDKSQDELYLPAELKASLLKKGSNVDADDLLEVRRLVINEIRFNERVIETLMPSLFN